MKPRTRRTTLTAATLLIASVICIGTAAASEPANAVSDCDQASSLGSEASWTVSDENDTFGLEKDPTDRFYTQGFRLTRNYEVPTDAKEYTGPRRWIDDLSRFTCRHRLHFWDRDVPRYRGQSVFIGQSIFTPIRIDIPAPIPDDRPYAGWLYVGARVETMELIAPWLTLDHAVELQLGMTGPVAQGKWVQSHFHNWIGSRPPEGWDNQLENEPGLFASYRLSARTKPLAGYFDAIPHAEVALGNVQTYAQAGLQIRAGRNLGPPFQVIAPTRALLDHPDGWYLPHDDTAPCLNGRYIFAIKECGIGIGIQARAVARNIFLDGNTFRDGPSVDSEPEVHDLMAGARLRWKYVQLDATFVRRSKEFSPVPRDARSRSGTQNYGALTVHCLGKSGILCPAFTAFMLAGLAAAQ